MKDEEEVTGEQRGQVQPLVKIQVAAEAPGLMGGGHRKKMRLGTMKRTQEKQLAKVQPSCCRKPQDFGESSHRQQKPLSGTGLICAMVSPLGESRRL